MRSFCAVLLFAAAVSAIPAKLGGGSHHHAHGDGAHAHNHGRQGRQQAADASYLSPQESQVVDLRVAAPSAPIGIVRNVMEGPLPTFRYNYETENEIQQSAEGELRTVGDSEVMVMRGSYSYVGPDGLTYIVDWYADETGFHPSAAHLPQPVSIPFPEVQAAVDAQLRFAAEEEAAASRNVNSYAAPEELGQYGRV